MNGDKSAQVNGQIACAYNDNKKIGLFINNHKSGSIRLNYVVLLGS